MTWSWDKTIPSGFNLHDWATPGGKRIYIKMCVWAYDQRFLLVALKCIRIYLLHIVVNVMTTQENLSLCRLSTHFIVDVILKCFRAKVKLHLPLCKLETHEAQMIAKRRMATKENTNCRFLDMMLMVRNDRAKNAPPTGPTKMRMMFHFFETRDNVMTRGLEERNLQYLEKLTVCTGFHLPSWIHTGQMAMQMHMLCHDNVLGLERKARLRLG